jgi:glycosyltransferase 2 family protein
MIANSEPLPPLPPRTKVRRYLFLLIVLGLSLYLLVPQVARMEHAFRVAFTLKIPFVALSLGAQILSYLGSGYLLRTVVRLVPKPVSVVEGALVTVGANSVGTLGGGVLGTAGMTYLWLRQRGVNPGAAGLGGWIPIFLNDATLAIVTLIGLLTLVLLKTLSSLLVLGFALAVLILAGGMGVLLWSLTHREKLMPLVMAIASFTAKIRRKAINRHAAEVALRHLLEAWDALLEGGWRGPAIGAALNTGFDMLTLAFLFLSAGHGVSVRVLIAGFGVPQLLGKLTVILGGIGVVETTMVGLYAALGVPAPIAVVVVLVYRLFSFWLPTFAGVALVLCFEHPQSSPDRLEAASKGHHDLS